MIVMVIAARKIPPTGKTKGGQDICKNLFPPRPSLQGVQVSAVSAELTALRSPVTA